MIILIVVAVVGYVVQFILNFGMLNADHSVMLGMRYGKEEVGTTIIFAGALALFPIIGVVIPFLLTGFANNGFSFKIP